MKRVLPIAAIMLVLTFAGQTALAPAAHAETQCQPAGSVEDVLFSQQNENSIQVDLGIVGNPMEATHGGRIPHCGDYCAVEGAGGGCVYYRNGVLTRTTATCQNGQWTPSP